MSTPRTETPGNPAGDAFPFGWRWREVTLPDGTIDLEQIPLTEEDLLHPEVGDEFLQNAAHTRDWSYLHAIFQARTSDWPGSLILSDHVIDWGVAGVRQHGPDVVVFANAPAWTGREGGIFHVAAVGARPLLVVEVTSPETRRNDLVAKRLHYQQVGIPCYLIVDRCAGPRQETTVLIALRRTAEGWEQVQPDAHGRIALEAVEVSVGIENDRVVCYDETGEPLPDMPELMNRVVEEVQARREAIEALEAETDLRRAAEEEARTLSEKNQLAEAARLAAEENTRRADAARSAAEEKTRLADAARLTAEENARTTTEQIRLANAARVAAEEKVRTEETARRDLLDRMAALEAELNRLRGVQTEKT